MQPSEDTGNLAKNLVEWKLRFEGARDSKYGKVDKIVQPCVLYIGSGCARAAGVPSYAEMARKLRDDLVATKHLSEQDQADESKLVEAFFAMLRGMTQIERYSLLQSLYKRVPVPLFYQDLAKLVRAGYFSHVLTANVDTLLEQALTGASPSTGLYRQAPYQVITLSPSAGKDPLYSPVADTTTIIKLPGDVAESTKMTSPEEIDHVLNLRRGVARSQFGLVLVMVGYEFEESQSVRDWLISTAGEKLWWVNPELPDQHQMHPIEEAWSVKYIYGPRAAPDFFFSKLVLRLLSLEDLHEKDPSDNEVVLNQIRLCKDALQSLSRRIASGERDPKIPGQIAYLRDKLRELERVHRYLEVSRSLVPELLDQIATSAEQAETSPETLSALRVHADQIKSEYEKPDPNDALVAASIGFTVDLVDVVGSIVPEALDSQAVRKLASFASSREV